MSNPGPRLPQEILDSIVDLLHDDPEMLKQCCLVSKSWVPHTRKHLFAIVEFRTPAHLRGWKSTFPDRSNSPARYTRTLSVNCGTVIVSTTDAVEGGWIPAFSRVTCLELENKIFSTDLEKVFTAFQRISATLRSLSLNTAPLPLVPLFNFICSLPHLENLDLACRATVIDDSEFGGQQAVVTSTGSPALTGVLGLLAFYGMARVVRRLLDLPNGVHFRTLKLSWCREEDLHSMEELLVACSDTVESLDITCYLRGPFTPFSSVSSATNFGYR